MTLRFSLHAQHNQIERALIDACILQAIINRQRRARAEYSLSLES
jgi:hypothetical protein